MIRSEAAKLRRGGGEGSAPFSLLIGCPRKLHFGIPRNTEVISGAIPAKFRGIPRNFAEFRRNCAEITSEVKKFRGIPCRRNSVDTLLVNEPKKMGACIALARRIRQIRRKIQDSWRILIQNAARYNQVGNYTQQRRERHFTNCYKKEHYRVSSPINWDEN